MTNKTKTVHHTRRAHRTPTEGEVVNALGIGIDTGRYGHVVAFLRDDKQPAAPQDTILESRRGYEKLKRQIETLHERHQQAELFVRIDAAGQYATNLETFLRSLELPLSVSVGEPKRNKDYHRAHSPKNKTDFTESLAMARYAVVERPTASPAKSAELIALQRVCSRLQAQVKQSTRLTNQLHETLSATYPELAGLVRDIKRSCCLNLLKKYPTAKRIAAAKLSSLKRIKYLDGDLAMKIHERAKSSVAALANAAAEAIVRELVDELEHSLKKEKTWKTLLFQVFSELPGDSHRQLVSIKGIGMVTAAAIVATAGSIENFPTAGHFIGYYGAMNAKSGWNLPELLHVGSDLIRLRACFNASAANCSGVPI